ncbi:hypothetical protein QBE52_16870 [Clostridiaceae bacterium 35-E11]
MKKRWIIRGVVVSLIVVIFVLPYIFWELKGEKIFNVLIVDKTVPNTTYREHKGVTWILNHFKYKKTKGDAPYMVDKDYFGFMPQKGQFYEIRNLPSDLEDTDLIYIADTYGVYEDEFYGVNKAGNRSELIYGGIEKEEVEKIRKEAFRGKTVIAEFNAFGSPTPSSAKEALYELLGLTWSGWMGRYFQDLSKDVEVPDWAVQNYEKQYGEKWTFQGAGILLVNEKDEVLVLEKDIEIKSKGCFIEFTPEGQKMFGVKGSTRYHYWFDIVQEKNSKVLAHYQLEITDKGRRKLEERNIPITFPAVLKNENKIYEAYYFAGDYADHEMNTKFYKVFGWDKIKKILSIDTQGSQEAFYWQVYVPMMKKILAQSYEQKGQKLNELQVETKKIGEITVAANVGEKKIEILKNDQWQELLIKGVNMGIAKPGHFPGEVSITKEEYFRWFQYIGQMNANAVRVYTLHPPDFYEALYEYNMIAEKPLYLFHGVWIIEEELVKSQDAFAEVNVTDFQQAIQNTIDVIHGNAEIQKIPGHAGGKYTANVSPYVIGWILGIEWDPEMVLRTNEKHKAQSNFQGHYFYTENASPFEIWLAKMMEFTADYETRQYGWQRPMSFTNWVTTDLLNHPAEPSEKEDMVTVDPNHIFITDKYHGGYFASYHIYPYYPDFLNYEEKYVHYVDNQGRKNNYAGYLHDMHQVHRMPLLVAEFGVPASRGLTHKNVYGMDQGLHSEKAQGEIDAKLFQNIVEEGMAGGLIFTWQDEWFKRTWNTMDYDNPDRRPFWSNAQTNEQQFGLLSFDPGKRLKVKVDGQREDWEQAKIDPAFVENPRLVQSLGDEYDDGRNIKNLYVTSDARYLYLRIDYKTFKNKIDWNKMNTLILLDTKKDQGIQNIPFNTNLQIEDGIDFIVQLKGEKDSRIWIDSYYDTFYYHYGHILSMVPKVPYASQKNNGKVHPIRLTLNKALRIPDQDLLLPFESYETGILKMGIGDPSSPMYDSLADFYVNEKNNCIEVRIPWMLLNVKDPSTREVMGDFWKEGLSASEVIEGISIGVVSYKPDAQGNAIDTAFSINITDALPKPKGNRINKEDLNLYQWEIWEIPQYHERLKQSYYIIQKTFASYE